MNKFAMRLASWLFVIGWLFILLLLVTAVIGKQLPELSALNAQHFNILIVAILGTLLFVGLMYIALALRLRCPICFNRVLSERGQIHEAARTFMGLGYTGRIVRDVLILNQFTCMHCGSKISTTETQEKIMKSDTITSDKK